MTSGRRISRIHNSPTGIAAYWFVWSIATILSSVTIMYIAAWIQAAFQWFWGAVFFGVVTSVLFWKAKGRGNHNVVHDKKAFPSDERREWLLGEAFRLRIQSPGSTQTDTS